MKLVSAASKVDLDRITIDYYKRACKIPSKYQHMIVEVVQIHNTAVGIALGNLELCFRRTLAHAEDLMKEELKQRGRDLK